MALPLILALALLATAPTTAQEDGPMATAKPRAPQAAAAAKPAPAPASPPAARSGKKGDLVDSEPLPPGAPEDDYAFVSWCSGALRGHMELFDVVKPTLNALPDPDPKVTAASDAEMMQAGAKYLELYASALSAAEKASPTPINARRVEFTKIGRNIWGAAEKAEPKTRMWSWVMWSLPGRCEYAAERLYEKSMLKGQALGVTMRTSPTPKPTTPPKRNALGSVER